MKWFQRFSIVYYILESSKRYFTMDPLLSFFGMEIAKSLYMPAFEGKHFSSVSNLFLTRVLISSCDIQLLPE